MRLLRLIIRGRPGIVLLAVVAATFALAGQASAATPFMTTFTMTESFVDPGVSAGCGFPVTSTATISGRLQVFFDQSGNPIRAQVEESSAGNFTANGLAVPQTSHQVSIIDFAAGTETDIGILIHVSLPGGGTIFLDRGLVVFDSNGNILVEAGPHPSLHGQVFPALCAALTP
jgi:hypothetical protein